jgi:hypothetical protein
LKENTVRNLVLQGRQDLNAPELAQSLENLVSNWSNLQKKVDTKAAFYKDIYTLHEELKSNNDRDYLYSFIGNFHFS